MQTRSRSAEQVLQEAQQQVHGPKTSKGLLKDKLKRNAAAGSALQQPGAASVLNASATSTDAVVAQLHPDSSQVQQPLETLIEVAETYFSAHNDAELLAAAQGVAGIWLLQDTSIRARLSTVLGPVLAREAQLSQRAAAIAAKRQAVRAKAAEQGPRRSGRKRAVATLEAPGDDTDLAAASAEANSNSSCHKRLCSSDSKGPAMAASAAPSLHTPPLPDAAPLGQTANNGFVLGDMTASEPEDNAGNSSSKSGDSSGDCCHMGSSSNNHMPGSSPELDSPRHAGSEQQQLGSSNSQLSASWSRAGHGSRRKPPLPSHAALQ